MNDVLEHPLVQAWRKAHPQQWWAFHQLDLQSELCQGVLAALLAKREDDEHIDQLVRFGEALEGRRRAERTGTMQSPPADGERRSFEVRVKRMRRIERDQETFFRVDFSTAYGWSGYFDTKIPSVVERVFKNQRRRGPLTLVGEVVHRPHDFLVVLGDRVLIV